MTKQFRKATALCLPLPFSLMKAGERIGFISLAHSFYDGERLLIGERHLRDPRSTNSNNPLAVELETENDVALKFLLSPVLDFTSIGAAARATTRIS